MNKILLSIVVLLLSTSIKPQDKYKIMRENETSTHQLGINKYYFVHQTFADSFFMTNLYKQLSYDDMTLILKNVYDGVTKKEKVKVEYDVAKSGDAKVAYFFSDDKKTGDIFIMLTNFSNATRKFEPNPDPKDQLARWYYIKGEKLVYRKDLYSKAEEEKIKKGGAIEIIDYYLFDDNFENDKLVKPLIDDLLASDDTDTNKMYGYLYLSEYYLLNDDLDNSEKAIKSLTKLYEDSETIPRNYSLIVNMATTEYEIMKRM